MCSSLCVSFQPHHFTQPTRFNRRHICTRRSIWLLSTLNDAAALTIINTGTFIIQQKFDRNCSLCIHDTLLTVFIINTGNVEIIIFYRYKEYVYRDTYETLWLVLGTLNVYIHSKQFLVCAKRQANSTEPTGKDEIGQSTELMCIRFSCRQTVRGLRTTYTSQKSMPDPLYVRRGICVTYNLNINGHSS